MSSESMKPQDDGREKGKERLMRMSRRRFLGTVGTAISGALVGGVAGYEVGREKAGEKKDEGVKEVTPEPKKDDGEVTAREQEVPKRSTKRLEGLDK